VAVRHFQTQGSQEAVVPNPEGSQVVPDMKEARWVRARCYNAGVDGHLPHGVSLARN